MPLGGMFLIIAAQGTSLGNNMITDLTSWKTLPQLYDGLVYTACNVAFYIYCVSINAARDMFPWIQNSLGKYSNVSFVYIFN